MNSSEAIFTTPSQTFADLAKTGQPVCLFFNKPNGNINRIEGKVVSFDEQDLLLEQHRSVTYEPKTPTKWKSVTLGIRQERIPTSYALNRISGLRLLKELNIDPHDHNE